MEGLLQHEAWAKFDQSLKLTTWQADEMEDIAQKASAWEAQRKEISVAKQARLSELKVLTDGYRAAKRTPRQT